MLNKTAHLLRELERSWEGKDGITYKFLLKERL
jgi:hypothetical protein